MEAVAKDYKPDQVSGTPREFSWLLRTAVAAFLARALGRRVDLRFRVIAIRCGRARHDRQRTGHLLASDLPEWLDFLHSRLWRYYSDLGTCPGACRGGSGHGLWFPWHGHRISAHNLFVFFPA